MRLRFPVAWRVGRWPATVAFEVVRWRMRGGQGKEGLASLPVAARREPSLQRAPNQALWGRLPQYALHRPQQEGNGPSARRRQQQALWLPRGARQKRTVSEALWPSQREENVSSRQPYHSSNSHREGMEKLFAPLLGQEALGSDSLVKRAAVRAPKER